MHYNQSRENDNVIHVLYLQRNHTIQFIGLLSSINSSIFKFNTSLLDLSLYGWKALCGAHKQSQHHSTSSGVASQHCIHSQDMLNRTTWTRASIVYYRDTLLRPIGNRQDNRQFNRQYNRQYNTKKSDVSVLPVSYIYWYVCGIYEKWIVPNWWRGIYDQLISWIINK